jgi:hypothetical protein
MNYRQPWHTLDIDISNALRKDLDLDEMYRESEFNGQPLGVWYYMTEHLDQLLNPDWLDYAHSINFPVISAMVFYRDPYYVHPGAHVDLFWDGTPCISAINWVLDPKDDSKMVWYDVPNDTGQLLITPAGPKYLHWDTDTVENHVLDQRCVANQPTVVRIGIPHNVIVNSRPRWVISLRLDRKKFSATTWEETVDQLKPFIVE